MVIPASDVRKGRDAPSPFPSPPSPPPTHKHTLSPGKSLTISYSNLIHHVQLLLLLLLMLLLLLLTLLLYLFPDKLVSPPSQQSFTYRTPASTVVEGIPKFSKVNGTPKFTPIGSYSSKSKSI